MASLGSQAWNFFHSSFFLPDFGIFSPVFKMGLQILYRNVCQLMSCCHTTRACTHSTGFHTNPLQETEGEREREKCCDAVSEVGNEEEMCCICLEGTLFHGEAPVTLVILPAVLLEPMVPPRQPVQWVFFPQSPHVRHLSPVVHTLV